MGKAINLIGTRLSLMEKAINSIETRLNLIKKVSDSSQIISVLIRDILQSKIPYFSWGIGYFTWKLNKLKDFPQKY